MDFFMHHYPQMSEYDILFKDWDWVDFHHKVIEKRIAEERRFSMIAIMTSCAAAFNGGEAMEEWNSIFEGLLSPEELKVVRAEEERRLQEQADLDKEEKIREWLRNKEEAEQRPESGHGEQGAGRKSTLLGSL